MDEIHDVTEDYMKLVVNKLCHVKLLAEKCIPMEWEIGTEGDEYKPRASHLLIEADKTIKIYKYHQNTTKFIILYHFWTTCFDSLESSSGPLGN